MKLCTTSIVVAWLTGVAAASAQPVVTDVSGTWDQGSTMTVLGSGFGSKAPARPLVWAPSDGSLILSSLGERTQWDFTQNLVVSQDCPSQPAGASCMKADNGSGVWTAALTYSSWNTPGQRSYVYRLVRKNFVVTDNSQNWKIFRVWPYRYSFPDLYISENNGLVNTENSAGILTHSYFSPHGAPANAWTVEEFAMQAARTQDVMDGTMQIRADGRQVAETGLATLFSANSAPMELSFPVHFVLANASRWQPAWSQENRVWVDDVYVDTTWARVMVGNASSYAACTHLVPQIPMSWSNTSITITAHRGALQRIDTPYLYVIDEHGSVNAGGLPLTPSQAVPPRSQR